MGVRILEGAIDCADAPGQAALFCSTSNTAFGPLFHSGDEARDFLDWYAKRPDARELRAVDGRLLSLYVLHFRREVMDATPPPRASEVA